MRFKFSFSEPEKQHPNKSEFEPTLSASSLICRLFIRLFQSSLAFATLALIPSTLSLDTTAISSSPLAPTVLSLAWPCSLSLKNSCGDTQTKTKELWLFNTNTHTKEGGCENERRKKRNGLNDNPQFFCIFYFWCNGWWVTEINMAILYKANCFFQCPRISLYTVKSSN